MRIIHGIAIGLTPEHIMDLSKRLGEWYNGQGPLLRGNQVKKLRTFVNGFLSEVGCPKIPKTAEELDYRVRTGAA